MNNINEKMTHPQNGEVNQFSGYGAPKMEDFSATKPSGQGVDMGTGPIMGDPEKGMIANDMHVDGASAMNFKSSGSDPSQMPLPHNRSYAEFKPGSLETGPKPIVARKVDTDKVIHQAKTQIY